MADKGRDKSDGGAQPERAGGDGEGRREQRSEDGQGGGRERQGDGRGRRRRRGGRSGGPGGGDRQGNDRQGGGQGGPQQSADGNKRGRNRKRRGQRGRGQREDVAIAVAEEDLEVKEGLLEIMSEGFGFLRFTDNYYLPSDEDVHVGSNLIKRYEIRAGSMIRGDVAPAQKRGQKPTLVRVHSINGKPPEVHKDEVDFKNLVACDPDERIKLEVAGDPDPSMRVIDLLAPIGKGQRALIVAPPRTGKTVIMQKMANAIAVNHPEAHVIILLIDERPEEVTDMKRNTKAEVIASCLDEGTANHVRVTETALLKLRRLVEAGRDVVCLLDSITRLGRAYNNETKHSGRILSGGVDAKTLAKPKAFFGAARNVDNGGSLTIIATALIDTGSRMDQVIFEEFKGTGNMELVLSRQLANNRIFPAVDIAASGTRKEEKLFSPDELKKVNVLRRVLNQLNPNEAMRLLIDRMEKTESNDEFLAKFDPSS